MDFETREFLFNAMVAVSFFQTICCGLIFYTAYRWVRFYKIMLDSEIKRFNRSSNEGAKSSEKHDDGSPTEPKS